MMHYVGVIGRGFLIWLVPFVVSFFFYSREGELATSYALFKSVMVLVLTAITLAVNIFRPVKHLAPVWVALIYTLISVVLDWLIVVPFARLTVGTYIEQILLVYSIIPALTWGILSRRTPALMPQVQ
jgi:hypothetical protein